ncbi:hypothetical protein KIN20_017780 [Parelaphostrongylus tenuis]|uniref:Uncharacterized protein n=1 Tax=Parelaphostrongylus tenuis TaxID=148309 RepID=A0AAD5N6Q2_PARTN|nr:hypothetical protein KIN20_017780 [Parelaphostrongylus tenuis]
MVPLVETAKNTVDSNMQYKLQLRCYPKNVAVALKAIKQAPSVWNSVKDTNNMNGHSGKLELAVLLLVESKVTQVRFPHFSYSFPSLR